VFNKSLTIVLPVHNAESRLRKNVGELLDLASELTSKFGVLIVDDGSSDSTFEVAEELAAQFPQVSVRRHQQCRGLGATIDYVQRRVRSDAVILHDGITPINAQHVQNLWRQWGEQPATESGNATHIARVPNGLSDFAELPAVHAAMVRAHRQVLGFQLLSVHASDAGEDPAVSLHAATPRTDASHTERRDGVGQIPKLPRPKFVSALAEFALGE
jgi:Glycosyl transferase family 2